ncbi:hypothetical protein SGFS_084230 [Streptomyces graminofaciens]|uniref:Large membrane protein n=1 Tax=Streptomyces graminofaciens TaxID=68212 RepID=A0ABN5VUH8_9ACTN|nr:hypothetical protein [Streptomyces graminofaciens]BBC37129.1 hypothetical protein SGFS_084230 [Streptomyces graminofaciens]
MNSERPDNPENLDNPDEGTTTPDAVEETGTAGDEAAEADETAEAEGVDDAETGDAETRNPETRNPETGDAEARDAEARDAEAESAAGDEKATACEAGEKAEAGEAGGAADLGADLGAVHGAARPRRRRSPVLIASVTAAVLLVGGGGAYLATSASSGSAGSGGSNTGPSDEGTPPPLALDGYSEGGPHDIAPGEPDPNGVTYRADGELPDGPDSAPVYRAGGEVTAAEVARLAKALGVEGKPVAEDGFWRVGNTADGSGPGLQVAREAPGAWTFNRSLPGTDNCQKVEVCASGVTAEGTSADADPVSEAAAKKAAAPVLKAVGQDDAKIDATGLTGTVRVVNADPEVGGLPTYGWATGIQVGPDGEVVGGSGNLKAPVKSDTYPVVAAERALELLNGSGRTVGIGGCATAVPAESEGTADSLCEPSTTVPEPKRQTVPVREAVFGLASHFVDGKSALVPSWLFDVRPKGADESFTVTQPAVDPKYLAAPETLPAPTPSGEQPAPVPSDPGDSPSSHDVKIQGYEADGDKLTVSFWGGVCSDYSAAATEDGKKVTVTVTATPWKGKVCILIAKVVERTVTLDSPLGDRAVVGSDGRKIAAGGLDGPKPR